MSVRRVASLAGALICTGLGLLAGGAVAASGPAPVNPAGCSPPSAGRVALWRGEGSAFDSVGSGDGLLVSGGYQAGEVGQAFSLPGTSDWMKVPDAPDLQLTGDLTIDSWVELNAPLHFGPGSGTRVLVAKGDASIPSFTYALYVGSWRGDASASTAPLVFTTGDWNTNEAYTGQLSWVAGHWYHVAAVRSGASVTFYRDGVEVGSMAEPAPPAAVPTSAGLPTSLGVTSSASATPTNPLQGGLDEVGIWNRALSAPEVQALYGAESGSCATTPPPTSTAPPPPTTTATTPPTPTPTPTPTPPVLNPVTIVDVSGPRRSLTLACGLPAGGLCAPTVVLSFTGTVPWARSPHHQVLGAIVGRYGIAPKPIRIRAGGTREIGVIYGDIDRLLDKERSVTLDATVTEGTQVSKSRLTFRLPAAPGTIDPPPSTTDQVSIVDVDGIHNTLTLACNLRGVHRACSPDLTLRFTGMIHPEDGPTTSRLVGDRVAHYGVGRHRITIPAGDTMELHGVIDGYLARELDRERAVTLDASLTAGGLTRRSRLTFRRPASPGEIAPAPSSSDEVSIIDADGIHNRVTLACNLHQAHRTCSPQLTLRFSGTVPWGRAPHNVVVGDVVGRYGIAGKRIRIPAGGTYDLRGVTNGYIARLLEQERSVTLDAALTEGKRTTTCRLTFNLPADRGEITSVPQ